MFWSAERHPPVLLVEAQACDADDPDAIDLRNLPCAAIVCRALDGHEQAVLGNEPRCIRIEVLTGTLLKGPVRLRYRLSGVQNVDARILTLRRLIALIRLGRLPVSLFPPERRARRWAQAFQAWDGARAGASHREIAVALFGPKRVEKDWPGAQDLRMRVTRLIRTAERLIDGGYRDLLRS